MCVKAPLLLSELALRRQLAWEAMQINRSFAHAAETTFEVGNDGLNETLSSSKKQINMEVRGAKIITGATNYVGSVWELKNHKPILA